MVSLEYIAGFFDGEGYIAIQKASERSHSGSEYWLIASMVNTHEGVLNEIQKVTGGRVIFHKGQNGCKHHYRLTLYSTRAHAFLKLIHPYLIIKKQEAEIAFKYYERNKTHRGSMGLTQEQITFQELCYVEMKALHGSKIRLANVLTSKTV